MRLFSSLFAAFFLFTAGAHAGVLLQGFYWDAPSQWDYTWWDRLANTSNDLARSGFSAVWIPPVLKGASGGYSNGYDPYDDYDMGSKDQRSTYPTHWGTREQLQRAVGMMRANGLDVYVDTVLAHRNGDDGYGNFRYRNAWGEWNGGRFEKYSDYFWGWNAFGRQLNHEHGYVRSQLAQAGDWMLNALGAQGLRIDMAKNVSPGFLREYLGQGAMNGKFAVSEYWSENTAELENYVRSSMHDRVSVFDFPLWGLLRDMANAGGYFDMRRLVNAGLASRLPNRAVTFVENHDTDRDYPTYRNKHLAYAYILTAEGYPSVFWKDYWNYGNKQFIDPLIWIHEKLATGPTQWRWSDDDLLIYERGHRLLVGLNDNSMYERKQWIQTGFGGFVTLHDYTGHKPDIRTEYDGRVEIAVPANSYVAYAPAGINSPHDVRNYKVTQQFAGANDLDIPPAVKKDFHTAGRVWAAAGTWIDWTLFHGAHPDANGNLRLLVISPQNALLYDMKMPVAWNSKDAHIKVESTGYHEFKIKLETSETIDALPYWLRVTYQAPQRFD